MKKLFKKIYVWVALTISSIMINISIALKGVENELFEVLPILDKNKHNQRMRHQNKLLEKFYAGDRDEQYMKDYYEVLKRGDKFLREVTPEKAEMVADKHGLSLGKKDKWGRRYDHFGFFDPTNKNYGKTLGEVIELERNQRRTTDDDYDVEIMFDNSPIVGGFNDTHIKEIGDDKYESLNTLEKALYANFPMSVYHKNEKPVNRIEQLTKYLHIKRIDDDHKQLEFFIPTKFKLFDLSEEDDIFKEIIDIRQIWIKDEYGTRYGYSVDKYKKRIEYSGSMTDGGEIIEYHVLKFNAIIIKNI